MAVLLECLADTAEWLNRKLESGRSAASGVRAFWHPERESSEEANFVAGNLVVAHGRVFHNLIHRYFVITRINALTSVKQLFSLSRVDG